MRLGLSTVIQAVGELGLLQLSEKVSVVYLEFCEGGCSTSFWKRGTFRSGSNIGSSRRSAGVSGIIVLSEPAYGIERRFCKAAMARAGSPLCAATRAGISRDQGPVKRAFSIGFAAMARFDRANAGR